MNNPQFTSYCDYLHEITQFVFTYLFAKNRLNPIFASKNSVYLIISLGKLLYVSVAFGALLLPAQGDWI